MWCLVNLTLTRAVESWETFHSTCFFKLNSNSPLNISFSWIRKKHLPSSTPTVRSQHVELPEKTAAARDIEDAPVCPCSFVQDERPIISDSLAQHTHKNMHHMHTSALAHTHTSSLIELRRRPGLSEMVWPFIRENGWNQRDKKCFCAPHCTLEETCVLMCCSNLYKLKKITQKPTLTYNGPFDNCKTRSSCLHLTQRKHPYEIK